METLEALTEEGITLGVVTGKRRQLAMRGMQLFGIDAYMQAIVTPEDTMLHKPNPEPILKALELLEQSPEEIAQWISIQLIVQAHYLLQSFGVLLRENNY